MNKKFLSFFRILILYLFFNCIVQLAVAQSVVIFADSSFKAAVVANREINKNGDSEIQVSEAAAFKKILAVGGLNIRDLGGIEYFTSIIGLFCNNNILKTLDVSNNTKLTVLRCDHNQLSSLNLTNTSALQNLHCNVNQLTTLDISGNPQLAVLWCFENQLTELSTAANTHLTEVDCRFNPFQSLDFSHNPELAKLNCSQTSIGWLNLKNGNNTTLTTFDASLCRRLLCVQVDDVSYAEANWRKSVGDRVVFRTDCSSANNDVVYIPDPNFKTALVSYYDMDKNGDGEIQVVEASTWYSGIDGYRKNIHDVTGIEAFVNAGSINFTGNPITNIDLSHNTGLRELKIDNTQVTTLDLRANTKLQTLQCFQMPLANLNISQCINLQEIWCFETNATSLDVSASTKMRRLECHHNKQLTSLVIGSQPSLYQIVAYYNQLTALDITQAPNLSLLQCNMNKLTTLDLHANTKLTLVECHDNLLEALDVSQCIFLRSINCTKNKLRTLDFSYNADLIGVVCNTNQLTFINVKNGNNTRMRAESFSTIENPKLTCIQVDDPEYSKTNWTKVDPQTRFSVSCNGQNADVVTIPDRIFKARLVNDPSINTNADTEIQFSEAKAIKGNLTVASLGINFLTGIEAFTSLTGVNCSQNNLTRLFVDQIPTLRSLDCSSNTIGEITINTGIENILASHNYIWSLNLTGVNSLKVLDLNTNRISYFNIANAALGASLSKLDLANNDVHQINLGLFTGLKELYLSNNRYLPALNVSACTQLEILYCNDTYYIKELNAKNGNNTRIKVFEATGNPYLKCVQVDDTAYARAHFHIDDGAHFNVDCSPEGDVVYIPDANFRAAMTPIADGLFNGTKDGKIQYREAELVKTADVSGKGIHDLTGFIAFFRMRNFNCANNEVTEIPFWLEDGWYVSPGLQYLNASNNNLNTLPPYQFIIDMDVSHNQLTSVDASQNRGLLQTIICSFNNLTSLNVKFPNSKRITTFNATNNPDLYCIEVEDPAYAEEHWRSGVDPQASFNTDCPDMPTVTMTAARTEAPVAYPNPASSALTINSIQPVGEVQIFDIVTGELRSTQNGNQIDVRDLKKGIYRMSIQQGDKTSSIRIIKQ